MIKIYNFLISFIFKIKVKVQKMFEDFFFKYPLILVFSLVAIIFFSIKNNDLFTASIYLSLVLIFTSMLVFFRKQIKNRNSADLDNYERVVRSAGVLSLGFLAITIIMINVGKFIVPDILHIGSIDSWIQFSGSILGGTLTLFALAITLNENENIRKAEANNKEIETRREELNKIEALEFSNPPILKLNVNSNIYRIKREKLVKDIYNNFPEKDTFEFKIYLELSNTSSSSITNVEVIDFEIYNHNDFSLGAFNDSRKVIINSNLDIMEINDELKENELIPPNTAFFIEIPYILRNEVIYDFDEFPTDIIVSKLKLAYKSVLLKKTYQLEFVFSFYISRIESPRISNDFEIYEINIFNLRNKYKMPKL